MLLGFFKNRLLFRADGGFQRHDHRLPQGINGRVGYLGELLAEVVVEWPHLPGEHGHGRVVPHGADGFLAAFRKWLEQLFALFKTHLLALHGGKQLAALHKGESVLLFDQVTLDAQGVVLEPLFVGVALFEARIDCCSMKELAAGSIHRDDLSGTKLSLGHHLAGIIAVHPYLRSHGEEIVAGAHPARGSQTVSVQGADRVATIADHQPGRTVPGLAVHGVELVEGAQVWIQMLCILPGRRDEHAQGTV